MAFDHGKGTALKIDNSGGTLTDISSYCNNVDFPQEVSADETTTYGNDDRTYIVGLKGATISVSGFFDATLDAVLGPLLGQPAGTFEYGPQGSAGSDIKYSGECILTSYGLGSPIDGVATWTADFTISGAVARSTF